MNCVKFEIKKTKTRSVFESEMRDSKSIMKHSIIYKDDKICFSQDPVIKCSGKQTKLTVFFLNSFGTVLTEHLITGSWEKQILSSLLMMECFMMDLLSLISDSKTDLVLVFLISNLTQLLSSDL